MRRILLAAGIALGAVPFGSIPSGGSGGASAQEAARAAVPAPVARGRYLVETIAACGNCHTPRGPDGAARHLAGGAVFEEPPFRAVAPNITPDRDTGIGRWTDAELALAIREGRRPDGTIIGPPMPMELYRGLSDADLAAMVAYLRTVAPVRNAVPRSDYRMPLPASYGPSLSSVAGPADDSVSRGAYLAGPLGHCIECHTPMTAGGGRDWSRTGAGGQPFEGPWGVSVARNITPDPDAGIGRWTDAELVRAITAGISADGRRLFPPMGFEHYARMTPGDVADLVAYLRALPSQP